MFPTPSSSANVPRHLPSPSPSPLPGDEEGLCGLTGDQWHMVMKFIIPLLLLLAIALVISLYKGAEISFLWLGVQDRFNTIRMGLREKAFGHLLSEDDIRSGLITTGPEITPRRYPMVNFILARFYTPPNAP